MIGRLSDGCNGAPFIVELPDEVEWVAHPHHSLEYAKENRLARERSPYIASSLLTIIRRRSQASIVG